MVIVPLPGLEEQALRTSPAPAQFVAPLITTVGKPNTVIIAGAEGPLDTHPFASAVMVAVKLPDFFTVIEVVVAPVYQR